MFLLTKIIGFFLNPFVWIIILLLMAWFMRNIRRKKNLYRVALIVFLFFSNNYILKLIWFRYQAPPMEMKAGEKYMAGIVLGGFVSYDEINKRAFFNQSADRFIQAARLYKEGYITHIIISGGNALFVKDADYSEADFVVNNLVDLGIPSADILAERKAKNTLENSQFSNRMLDSAHIPGPYVLITSSLHMPRAKKIFEKSGMVVRPYPCDFKVTEEDTRFTWRSIIPSSEAFGLWSVLLREFIGTLSLSFTQR